jgi:hypothetical protein
VSRSNSHYTKRWRLDRQAAAVSDLISAAFPIYNALRERFENCADESDEQLPPIDWTAWNRALDHVALMATSPGLASAAREWDRQTWRLSRAPRYVVRRDRIAWLQIANPYATAQKQFIDAARRAFGNDLIAEPVSGAPGPDDELVDAAYWRQLEAGFPPDGDRPVRSGPAIA